jgi:protein-tyrosine phosphatase
VLSGSEVWFGDDLVELLEKGAAGPLTTLAGSRALLVEFPPGWVWPRAAAVFHELRVMGVVPVVAHPERNVVFAREPERLAALVERGAVAQVTAASFLGEAGRGALAAVETFMKMGLVHLVASDAHSMTARPPRMAAARERVRKAWGAETEEGLFVKNPRALLAGEELPWPG